MKLYMIGLLLGSMIFNLEAIDWINPTKKECTKYHGKPTDNGLCEANWEAASAICASKKLRLPSVAELKNVIIECGGEIADSNVDDSEYSRRFWANHHNNEYATCMEKKGFPRNSYWSNTIIDPDYANRSRESMQSGFGTSGRSGKYLELAVRCVKP